MGSTDHPYTSETSLAHAYLSKDHQRAGASNTAREFQERTQLGEENRRQARRQAEQLVKDAIVSDVIKEDWMKLIQAEDIFASDATAFIPRVQEEETNPTFEHPEDWNSLSLQEKAHLILADKAVKLMRLLCREKVTRQQESEICTRQISITPPVVPEMAGRVGGGREGRAYISQTPRDLTVSSPQAVGETGCLSSFPPNGGRVRGHTAYKQGNSMDAKSEGALTAQFT